MREITALLIIVAGVAGSIATKKLTRPAAVAGGMVALLIFMGAGITGISMLAAFFVSASLATSAGIRRKALQGLAESNHGKRTTGQVLANGGAAALISAAGIFYPGYSSVLAVLAAASLSAAAADTVSSEIGNAFGSSFFNILTFRKDAKGLDGVVSPEGSLSGIAASLMIAVIYSIGYGWGANTLYVVIAGTLGNIIDSALGAGLERRNLLSNDMVNFLNTLFAAVAAFLLLYIFG